MKFITKSILAVAIFFACSSAFCEDEVSLFDGQGDATAYIALSDGMTIYLWNGRPVAYLDRDSAGGFNVYGFNGKHLGWFINGVIWDHNGSSTCAIKERIKDRIGMPKFEPFKSFKQFKPFKGFKEFAPFRPIFSSTLGDMQCEIFLEKGGV